MKTIIKLILIVLVLFTFTKVNAQEKFKIKQLSDKTAPSEEVVVYMKSGTMFSGEVKEWKIGEYITIITDAGSEYTFKGDSIDKVIQMKLYEQSIAEKIKTPYNFKETGIYYSIKHHFIRGNLGDRANESIEDGTFGMGISALVGKRFHRLLGVGLGVGYDSYILNSGERVMPIFAEATGFLSPRHTTLSYGLAAGYSLAFNNEGYNIVDAKGGLMVHPHIGFRFGKGKVKYTLDGGYRFQKAEFTYRDAWDGRSRNEERLLYKRITFRFGVLF